jgi:NAD(P)-dependent dehydrogenase (short-subunit alcohol dehydrogenase family)
MDTNNSVDNLDEETWDKILAINLTVPTLLSKHVVNVFRKQGGGSIVNVSSKAGISGAVAGVAYTSSKHAIVRFIKFYRLPHIQIPVILRTFVLY